MYEPILGKINQQQQQQQQQQQKYSVHEFRDQSTGLVTYGFPVDQSDCEKR